MIVASRNASDCRVDGGFREGYSLGLQALSGERGYLSIVVAKLGWIRISDIA